MDFPGSDEREEPPVLYLKTSVRKPIEFISSGQFVSEVPWTHSRRSIDSFEMIIGVHKTLPIAQDGVDYEVHPGNVLLLLPELVHEGNGECEAGMSFFWFHFRPQDEYELIDAQTMEREVTELKMPDAFKERSDIYIPLFSSPQGIERVNILFRQLQHVVNANYYTLQSAHYLVTSLLIELSEQTVTDLFLTRQKSRGDRTIAEMIEWVRIHALENIAVSDVADKFAYNRDYLSRVFKLRTGINLQEYIHLIKIAKAKDMLSRSRKSIKEIAQAVGVDDEKYFMRLFKKYENMTPTEYRTAFYKTHMNNH